MAYIEKRKHANGKLTYQVRVRQAGSPDISATFATRSEAIKWLQKIEAEIQAGHYFGREVDIEKPFAKFVDRYIEKELPKHSKSYRKQKQLLSWWRAQLGNYFLYHITPAMIADLRERFMSDAAVNGKFWTPSTANRYLSALSRAHLYAVTMFVLARVQGRANPEIKVERYPPSKIHCYI